MIDRIRAAWRQAIGEGRIVRLGLGLRLRGHWKAARMAEMWVSPNPTKEEVAKARANLLRRYPGR